MKKKETCYGILAMQQAVALGVYVYIPKLVVSGIIYQENGRSIFKDSLGAHYPLATECRSMSENQLVILHLADDMEDWKTPTETCIKLQEKALRKLYLGFQDPTAEKVKIFSYNLFNVGKELELSLVAQKRIEDTSKKDALGEMLNQVNGDEIIPLTKEELEKIVKLPSLEAIQRRLKELLSGNEALTAHFMESEESKEDFLPLDMSHLSGERLLKYFDDACIAVRNAKTLLSVEKILCRLEESLKDVISTLTTWEKDEKEAKDIDVACEYGFRLVDEVDLIISSNNLDHIRNDVLNMQRTERGNVRQLAVIYDKYHKIEEEAKRRAEIERKKELSANNRSSKKIQAKELKAFLDRFVIGQEQAKRMVVSALVMNQLSENPEDRTSCLLVGPTGSGKTLIAETVSKYLDIPIEIVDITQVTVPGYVGGDLEDGLSKLLAKAGGDVKKAEEGVIVFDEIDKKGTEKNSDVSGRGVLHTLLSFVQGTTYNVKYNGKVVPFSTRKLTIFATGAFTEVVNKKRKTSDGKGYHQTAIGFNTVIEPPKKEDVTYPLLMPEDFVTYGNMPDELMGRFTTIAQLQGQTKESLRKILVEAENSPLLSEKKKLEKLGVTLCWTEGYLEAIVEEAMKRGTGARSLKSTIEKSILDARWEAIVNLGTYCSIVLTNKSVQDPFDCEMINQEGVSLKLRDILEAETFQSTSFEEKEKVKAIGTFPKK